MTITLATLGSFFLLLTSIYFINPKYRAQIVLVSRIFLGIVFIYSGFVKAVDPLGSTYKFTDYFNAFGMPFFIPMAFSLAIVLSSLEFLIGVGLLAGMYTKLFNRLAIAFMLIFTPVTLVLAISNPVSDCGCFGDALILTNWETFWKNIIIDLAILLVLVGGKTIKECKKSWIKISVLSMALIAIVGVSMYGYRHLPILDFRPYHVGVNIWNDMQMPADAPTDVYKSSFVYQNAITGQSKVFEESELSVPLAEPDVWAFVESYSELVSEGYHPPIHDFTISQKGIGDIADIVLHDSSYTFIIVSYDLSAADNWGLEQLEILRRKLAGKGYKTLYLTASLDEQINDKQDWFNETLGPDTNQKPEMLTEKIYFYDYMGEVVEFKETELPDDLSDDYVLVGVEDQKIESETKQHSPFYICDPITLKTIVRANPGLVLLKNGTILAKWHFNDRPTLDYILQTYPLKDKNK